MTPQIKQRIEQIRNGEVPEGYKQTRVGIIPEDWKVMWLKDKFDRLSRKNAEGNTNVLTISAQYGLINQEEFFKKEVASDDKSNYFLLHRGEYAYNKSYSNGYPFGAIKRLSRYDKGVVSPLYICFSANADNACPEYYEQYFEAGKMNHEIQAFAQEGARNHGLLNISVSDFFNSFILVPPVSEQQRIAKILSTQDKVIECYEKKIEQLRLMKKYYLQNMFPKRGETVPKIRFKGFTDPWEHKKLGDITASYSGGTPTAGKSEYYDGAIPFIRSGEIGKDHTELFISEIGLKNSSAAIVNIGDILYALYGATSGEVSRSKIKGAINQAILAILPNRGYDPEYLMQWLRMKKEPIINAFLQGGQGNLSGTIVKGLTVDIPCYDEQVCIGQYFSYIDNLITLHQRKLEEEKNNKKALQQLLLTGIVRV